MSSFDLVVEPSCFIYAGDCQSQCFTEDSFSGFEKTLITLRKIIELNNLRFACSTYILDCAREGSLFPWGDLKPPFGRNAYDARRLVLELIERHSYLLAPDCAADDLQAEMYLSHCRPVYSDEYVRLAWVYLLNEVSKRRVRRDGPVLVVLTGNYCTCDPERPLTSLQDEQIELRFRRVHDVTRSASGLLDPELFDQMCDRRKGADLPVKWETGSGHQPSVSIKRAVKRCAQDTIAIVLSSQSTWHHLKLAETCQLSFRADPSEILFRVSDGQSTVKGVFKTTAKNDEEQCTAMSYIARYFSARCREQGFQLSEPVFQLNRAMDNTAS